MSIKEKNSKLHKSVKTHKIDGGKLGIGLIGICVCMPYMLPSVGALGATVSATAISKGLITLGATALSGITAYSALDFFNKDENIEGNEEIKDESLGNINCEVKTNMENNEIIDNKINIDESKTHHSYNQDKREGGVVVC